ncbi:MAG: hypothetical protein ACRDPS_09680 [Nocardioides sp.]|uniref:hypothetical protein n=1 Tax=Nocardioides sp. TaxID=35761 RepID=UPI003D6C2728
MTRQESDALTGAAKASAGVHRKALALVGAQIGPWRVVSVEGPWFEVISTKDKSTRKLRAVDLLDLWEGARRNGHTAVLPKAAEPERLIDGITTYEFSTD